MPHTTENLKEPNVGHSLPIARMHGNSRKHTWKISSRRTRVRKHENSVLSSLSNRRTPKAHEDNRRGTGPIYSFQIPRDEYRRETLYGNGDHIANGTRSDKLKEMKGSIGRRRMPTKLIRPAMLYGPETLATTKRQ